MGALGKHPQNDEFKKANRKTYQQHMFKIIGIQPKNYDTFLRLDDEQTRFAEDFARRYSISKEDFVIGMNTGAGVKWPQKKWSIKNTSKLAEMLYNNLKAKIILFGGQEEVGRNNEIIATAKVPIINAGCGNSLTEFPALISLCSLVVTSDTLGMHIAIALKRKIVALFGPTSAAEIDLYGLGEKLMSPTSCYCCYDKKAKEPSCTDAITPTKAFEKIKKVLEEKVSIVITAFNEPESVGKAIESFLNQKILGDYELIVAAPDEETANVVKSYEQKFKQVTYFKDPGKGKSYALNLLLKSLNGTILIFTDGDVYAGDNSVNEMLKVFRDPQVGCVSGRVMSANPKDNMLGFWSHLLADAGAHRIRKELNDQNQFLECSGYLFAFRNGIIKDIPLDVAEDTVIPYIFWEKGYKVKYAENALVYVKNPTNFNDWLKQRKRTAKAHETLGKYVDVEKIPRVKSFGNEIKKGFLWALSYPKSLKEFLWTLCLFFARLYMWISVFYEINIKKKAYKDAWERVESTK